MLQLCHSALHCLAETSICSRCEGWNRIPQTKKDGTFYDAPKKKLFMLLKIKMKDCWTTGYLIFARDTSRDIKICFSIKNKKIKNVFRSTRAKPTQRDNWWACRILYFSRDIWRKSVDGLDWILLRKHLHSSVNKTDADERERERESSVLGSLLPAESDLFWF